MNTKNFLHTIARSVFAALLLFAVAGASPTRAGEWNGIEPLKSRRADVERVLGRPIQDVPGQTGTLRFKVAGGTVTVFFVNSKFVESRKLAPEVEGTVMQIVLQHERATDTPESLGLVNNSKFERQDKGEVSGFVNLKDGIAYTFVQGKLTTTRYSATAEDLARLIRKSSK
ncbi:MAG TPA: hypothetical protein VGV59_03900 [Pyrinomonadaceae bacterium]|nr:hypothetical protein [Pyrinomonadaceae bacterium]